MISFRFRNAVLPAVTLAALAASAFVMSGGPAEARKMNACALRQSYCNERCIMRSNDEGKISGCIQRTCDHQYRNCMRDSGGSGGNVRDHRARR
jgi:hypothetical protein